MSDSKKKKEVNETQESVNSSALLWDIAVAKAKEKDDKLSEDTLDNEKTLVFVGCRDSGKTSLILNYTERTNETPKPTVALEYTFCRKIRPNNIDRDIGNIWELGEGTFLVELLDVIIKPETISNLNVIITLDLSKLNELWTVLETFIEELYKRVHETIKRASKDNPKLKEKIKASIQRRIGDNPDKSKLNPFEIPVAIVATKYDVFETYEPEKRKLICKALRFVAHYYGTMLIFTSSKNEITTNKVKALINHFLFDGTFNNKQKQFDSLKPIIIPFGEDSFENIGQPPLSAADLNDPNINTPVDLWKSAFCKHFPQEEIKKDESLMKDHGNDPQFSEPIIDSLKEQKIREFENLRDALRKKRSQYNQNINVQIIS